MVLKEILKSILFPVRFRSLKERKRRIQGVSIKGSVATSNVSQLFLISPKRYLLSWLSCCGGESFERTRGHPPGVETGLQGARRVPQQSHKRSLTCKRRAVWTGGGEQVIESRVFSEPLLGDKCLECVTRTEQTGAPALDALDSHRLWGLASRAVSFKLFFNR